MSCNLKVLYPKLLLIIVAFSMIFECESKVKIHRCVLNDGSVVLQDIKCEFTQNKKQLIEKKLKQIKPLRKLKVKASGSENPIKKSNKSVPQRTIKPTIYRKNTQLSQSDNTKIVLKNKVRSFDISIEVLKRWGLFEKVFDNKFLHMKFKDNGFSLLVDFIFPDNKSFSTAELYDHIQLVGSQYTRNSREGEVLATTMTALNAKGVMATFSHVKVQNYKYTTKGVLFKDKWLIQFTLLSNDLYHFDRLFALETLSKSIVITQ